jgi:thioesterase domain-containing protein
MASHHLATIRTVQPSGPYYLGGRCFGAELALEVAHQLIHQGETVGLLFLMEVTPEDFSELSAPAAVRRFRRYRRREGLKAATREIFQQMKQRRFWKKAPYAAREVGRKVLARVRAARLRWLITRGRAIPDTLRNVALVNRVASRLHRSRGYPGRVTLILRSDPPGMYRDDPRLDWDRLATGYSVRYLPGLPADFQRESQLREVAAFLNEALRAASSRS